MTIKDSAGNAANLSLEWPDAERAADRHDNANHHRGQRIAGEGRSERRQDRALTLDFSENVTVAGGTPTLTLNDGGTATYVSGSGSKTLTFTYTVAAGQNVASLAATAVNLASGVTIKDSAGNAANLSLAGLTQSGPQIDTTIPTLTGISESPATGRSGLEPAGRVHAHLQRADDRRRPTDVDLERWRNRILPKGSSTNTLTFYYHVASGQNIASLAATAVNLPSGAAINDSAGNAAKLSLTGFSQQWAADRHHEANGDVGHRLAGDRHAISWSSDNDYSQDERGGDGRRWRALAPLERRRNGDLRERLRHQYAHLQIHCGRERQRCLCARDLGRPTCRPA